MSKNRLIFETTDLDLVEMVFNHIPISQIVVKGNEFIERLLLSRITMHEISSVPNMRYDSGYCSRKTNSSIKNTIYEQDRYNVETNNILFYSNYQGFNTIIKNFTRDLEEDSYALSDKKIKECKRYIQNYIKLYIKTSRRIQEELDDDVKEPDLVPMQICIIEAGSGIYHVTIYIGLCNLSTKYINNIYKSNDYGNILVLNSIDYIHERIDLFYFLKGTYTANNEYLNISMKDISEKNRFAYMYNSLKDIQNFIINQDISTRKDMFNNNNDILGEASGDYLIDNFLIITYLLTYMYYLDDDLNLRNEISTYNKIIDDVNKNMFYSLSEPNLL